jgi:hypothetical protein
MNTALEYSTRVVQEGDHRCKKSTLNDFVHLTPLRIPLMNPPYVLRYNFCTAVACTVLYNTLHSRGLQYKTFWNVKKNHCAKKV